MDSWEGAFGWQGYASEGRPDLLNYLYRGDAHGTWLESHFRWQIRTFWWGLLWVALCLAFVVATLGVGLLVAWLPLMVVGFWFIYRVARGWLRLVERRPI